MILKYNLFEENNIFFYVINENDLNGSNNIFSFAFSLIWSISISLLIDICNYNKIRIKKIDVDLFNNIKKNTIKTKFHIWNPTYKLYSNNFINLNNNVGNQIIKDKFDNFNNKSLNISDIELEFEQRLARYIRNAV